MLVLKNPEYVITPACYPKNKATNTYTGIASLTAVKKIHMFMFIVYRIFSIMILTKKAKSTSAKKSSMYQKKGEKVKLNILKEN